MSYSGLIPAASIIVLREALSFCTTSESSSGVLAITSPLRCDLMLYKIRLPKNGAKVTADLLDDFSGCTWWSENGIPDRRLEVDEARLLGGRHIRKLRRSRLAGNRQRLQFSSA